MRNGNSRDDQSEPIKPGAVDFDQIDRHIHIVPQAQINSYRRQLLSQGLAALAKRIKLLEGAFDVRGQIGGSTTISLAISRIPED